MEILLKVPSKIFLIFYYITIKIKIKLKKFQKFLQNDFLIK